MDSAADEWEEKSEVSWYDNRSKGRRTLECVLLNLCGIAWATDNNLLPAMFTEMKEFFNVGPAELSVLIMVRGITESLASFPAGFMAEIVPRPKLVCAGALLWAAGLFGCGVATKWWQVILARGINGVGLGVVQPLIQSLIADLNAPDQRGGAFGVFQFTGNIGSTGGTYMATSLAPLIIWGIMGWKFTLFLIGFLSALIGLGIMLLVGEPNTAKHEDGQKQSLISVFKENWPSVVKIMRIPTFLCIIGQGSFGIAPWFAFSFLTMWLELLCFPNTEAAGIYAFFGLGQAFCGLFGGFILDKVMRRFPDHGPPNLCIGSVAVGIPILYLILFSLGDSVDQASIASGEMGTVWYFRIAFFSFGLIISGNAIINNTLFSNIVPQAIFAYVYAVDRAVEGTIGAFGSPAVGYAAEKLFHYNKTAAEGHECSPPDAHSLGSGVFAVSAFAWGMCGVFYIGLHFTYPADRRRGEQDLVPGDGTKPVIDMFEDEDSEE